MRKIYLSGKNKHLYALVDDEDYEKLSDVKWYLHEKGYAINSRSKRMHRLVNGTPKGKQTDHINGDKLDNRRSNLRTCDNRRNHYNKGLRKDNKTGYKGVAWNKLCGKYEAYIKLPHKKKHLGTFKSLEEAVQVRKEAERELHGEFMFEVSQVLGVR